MIRHFATTNLPGPSLYTFEPIEEELLPEFYEFIIIVHTLIGNKIAFATCGNDAEWFHNYIAECGYDDPATLVVIDKDSVIELLLSEVCDMYNVDLNNPQDMYDGWYIPW